ncbi:MAG: response regulator [Gammaproteobacteria bacterium]|nr:response regulator [Gammaproteobacteria bacterium]
MGQEDGKLRILVVDDSRVIRVSVARILEQGYQVLQANDGAIGLTMARREKLDLVITDIMMPNLDGYGLICALRGEDEPELSNIPIIVMTSAEDDIVRERAYACGANAFILKPFNATQLMESVHTHLTDQNASAEELAAMYNNAIESVVVTDVVLPEDND